MNSSFQVDETSLAQVITEALTPSIKKTTEPVQCLGYTYIALRKKGVLLVDYWLDEEELFSALRGNISPVISQGGFKGIDTIELCLTRHFRPVSIQEFQLQFPNIKRGIRGIKLQYQGQVSLWSPTQMLAHNFNFEQVFRGFLDNLSISAQTFAENGGEIEVFEAKQALVFLKPQIKVVIMYRGNQIVPLEQISSQTISEMAQSMGAWLLRTHDRNGRLNYKYLSNQDKQLDCEDLISQLMAGLCLIRYAKFTGKPADLEIADRNLNSNLEQLFWLGAEMEYKEKLNATAIAALAILEHPDRDRYEEIFQTLCQEIDALWQPDDYFDIGYKLSDSKASENFDPGLVLLLWASIYKAHIYKPIQEEKLWARCRKSLFFYWTLPESKPHPTSIPWHTQAYALLYEETGDPILLSLIFEMNDWLVSLQQGNELQEVDGRGQFYPCAYREDGGLPNAATTGAYLQSLTDAYRLAIKVKDTARAAAYKLAIWRGLRNLRQLQFKDDVDMFYIYEREKVKGALRTTVYDNTIRLDNVYQSLIAIFKLCSLAELSKGGLQPRSAFRLIKQRGNIASLLVKIEDKSNLYGYSTSRQKTQNISFRKATKTFLRGIDNPRSLLL